MTVLAGDTFHQFVQIVASRRTGSTTIRPDSSRTSTTSSTARPLASITSAEILTAELLPHFWRSGTLVKP